MCERESVLTIHVVGDDERTRSYLAARLVSNMPDDDPRIREAFRRSGDFRLHTGFFNWTSRSLDVYEWFDRAIFQDYAADSSPLVVDADLASSTREAWTSLSRAPLRYACALTLLSSTRFVS